MGKLTVSTNEKTKEVVMRWDPSPRQPEGPLASGLGDRWKVLKICKAHSKKKAPKALMRDPRERQARGT